MKELEDEYRRFKKIYAEERLKSEIIQGAMPKKWSSHLREKRWLWQPY
jgi:putative transposase